MAAIGGDVVVGMGDVDVLRLMGWRCENETLVVDAVAGDVAIRQRQGVEVRHCSGIGSSADRVHASQLLRTEGIIAGGRTVGLAAHPLHSGPGSSGT